MLSNHYYEATEKNHPKFRTRMKRTHLKAQPLTATSSSAFARLEEQIGAGSVARTE